MYRESNLRSIAKAVSWRTLGSVATTGIVWILTRRVEVALAVGGFEAVSKMFLFYMHERAWDRVSFGKKPVPPAVIWFTGLSGSGKSTIATQVYERIRDRGWRVEYLDGDALRALFPKTGYTRSEREEHLRRVGHLASRLEEHGIFVVASFVSPYAESRDFVRKNCKNFIEVHVSTPLEECERRDVKGLYAKARRGEIKNFTGIDDPYEAPLHPELTIDTRVIPVAEAAARVFAHITAQH